ncbi:MAG: hypothetical protein GY938_31790 [Ketobacter sp.]|nr:hypothetical protein [Ketobacter sp.]
MSEIEKTAFSGCSEVVESNTAECEICDIGYYFDSNQCVECANSISQGCIYCDP